MFDEVVGFWIYDTALSVEVVVGPDLDRYRARIPG